MATKMTPTQRWFLKQLVGAPSSVPAMSIIHPSYTALGKRGLVTWHRDPTKWDGGMWVPTDAGRAALS